MNRERYRCESNESKRREEKAHCKTRKCEYWYESCSSFEPFITNCQQQTFTKIFLNFFSLRIGLLNITSNNFVLADNFPFSISPFILSLKNSLSQSFCLQQEETRQVTVVTNNRNYRSSCSSMESHLNGILVPRTMDQFFPPSPTLWWSQSTSGLEFLVSSFTHPLAHDFLIQFS